MKPRVFIPMHWQERPEVAIDFARRARTPLNTEVLALTKPGVVANLTFHDQLLDIHIIEPPKATSASCRSLPPGVWNRRCLGGDDPFADTDLPVDIE